MSVFNDEIRSPQKGGVYALSLLSNLSANMINELRIGTNRVNAVFNGPGDGGVSNSINAAVKSVFSTRGVAYPTFGSTNASNLNLLE